jgi:hypothetical protein
MPIVRDPEYFSGVDALILESADGDRTHARTPIYGGGARCKGRARMQGARGLRRFAALQRARESPGTTVALVRGMNTPARIRILHVAEPAVPSPLDSVESLGSEREPAEPLARENDDDRYDNMPCTD